MFTKPTETQAVVAAIDPSSQGAGAATTAWVSADDFHAYMAVVAIGAFGSGATVDAKIQQAKDSSGTGAKDITGKSVTQLVAAGGNNRQAVINFMPEDLDVNNGFTHVRLSVTVGTAASLTAGVLLGVGARQGPPSAAASVAQIV
ncbi:hypothetical protein [Cupriavidus alkaliphilus]|uniref:hypothetical protein n=1 Tax=Cupriavidus alkaliphilus TaxID=942866 RepID=UPI00161355AC|nr:hypothetical protein [Cupriavidus alkaliphilus]MBB2915863.1 hypothetical protein [Cupriavidus alkaliphilus]